MNNPYRYYNAHLQSPYYGVENRRETEIEYCFRIAAEKRAAEKAQRRRERLALVKAILRRGIHRLRTSFPASHGLLGH